MTIRYAVPEDMGEVLLLIKELAAFEKEPDAVVITRENLIETGFGKNPLFRIIVAEANYKIIGMVLFYNRFSTWKGKTIHLEDLIVTEKMRGTGTGFALYSKVLEIARQDGVKRVEWVVLNWNKNAIDFYKKSGATVLEDWYTVQMDEEAIINFTQKQHENI